MTNCSLKFLYLSWTYRKYKETGWLVGFIASGNYLFLLRTEKHTVPQEPRTLTWKPMTSESQGNQTRPTIWFPAKYEESS